jgi:hypothetical protein
MPDPLPDLQQAPTQSLVDVLDRLLDTGVVADGQIVLSVAGVDLIYVGVRALLASLDTAARMSLAPVESAPAGSAGVGHAPHV